MVDRSCWVMLTRSVLLVRRFRSLPMIPKRLRLKNTINISFLAWFECIRVRLTWLASRSSPGRLASGLRKVRRLRPSDTLVAPRIVSRGSRSNGSRAYEQGAVIVMTVTSGDRVKMVRAVKAQN